MSLDPEKSETCQQHGCEVMEGDAVTVEMSPFDLTRGRIVFRRFVCKVVPEKCLQSE